MAEHQSKDPLHRVTLEMIFMRLGGNGQEDQYPVFQFRSEHQIQLAVFTQDTLGESESGGVVFEVCPGFFPVRRNELCCRCA